MLHRGLRILAGRWPTFQIFYSFSPPRQSYFDKTQCICRAIEPKVRYLHCLQWFQKSSCSIDSLKSLLSLLESIFRVELVADLKWLRTSKLSSEWLIQDRAQ